MVKKSKTSKRKVRIVAVPKQPKAQVTALGKALRALGGIGGSALGGMLGAPSTGSTVGTGLGAALSRWLGSGDYTVHSNSLVSKASSGIPDMHKNNQTIMVRHKEYLGEILSSTGFVVRKSLTLNPGIAATFPWLSTIASNFQEYTFKGIVFHYIPTSGHAITGTNPAIGSVMMQTSYRTTDSAPTSKLEMLNEYYSAEAAPDTTFAHPIECDPKENPFNVQYVRTGEVPAGDSTLIYDLGKTHIAVSGNPANSNVVGDLWVSYEVELRKPILHSNVTSLAPFYRASYVGTGITSTDYFPTAITPLKAGNIPMTLLGRTLTFLPGSFGQYYVLLSVNANGAGFGGTSQQISGNPILTNMELLSIDYSSTFYYISTICTNANTLNCLMYACVVNKLNADSVATLALPAYSIATGVVASTYLQVTGTGEP